MRIGARSASGASASVRIEIVKRAAQKPAISPKPRVALRGRRVHVRTKPTRTVRVAVKVKRGRATVGSCRKTLVRARRSYVCRARVKRGVRLTKLKVVVTMTVGKRTLSRRTLSVPRAQELALALPPLSRQGRQPVLTAQLGAWRQSRASGTRRGMMLASSIPSRP